MAVTWEAPAVAPTDGVEEAAAEPAAAPPKALVNDGLPWRKLGRWVHLAVLCEVEGRHKDAISEWESQLSAREAAREKDEQIPVTSATTACEQEKRRNDGNNWAEYTK